MYTAGELLVAKGWRTQEWANSNSTQNHRNTLIVKLNNLSKSDPNSDELPIGVLQNMRDDELVQIGLAYPAQQSPAPQSPPPAPQSPPPALQAPPLAEQSTPTTNPCPPHDSDKAELIEQDPCDRITDRILPDGKYQLTLSQQCHADDYAYWNPDTRDRCEPSDNPGVNMFLIRKYGFFYHLRSTRDYQPQNVKYPFWNVEKSFPMWEYLDHQLSEQPNEVEVRITEGDKLRIFLNGQQCYTFTMYQGGMWNFYYNAPRCEPDYATGWIRRQSPYFGYERIGDIEDVDCVSEWTDISACEPLCGDGEITQQHTIMHHPMGAGTVCASDHGAIRKIACNNNCDPE